MNTLVLTLTEINYASIVYKFLFKFYWFICMAKKERNLAQVFDVSFD